MKNILLCFFISSLSLSAMNWSMGNTEALKTRLHEASMNKKSDLIICCTFTFIGVTSGIETALHLYQGEYDYAVASAGLSASSLWILKKLVESYRDNVRQEQHLRAVLARIQQRELLKKEE